MTWFVNDLPSFFPYGEKSFVGSVRTVCDRLEDPQLKKDVSAFIGQGAMHSREYTVYNKYAEEYGVGLEYLELRIKVLPENVSKVITRKHQLTTTCVLEHFTATMAAQSLECEDLTVQVQSSKVYELWMWHAIKENEHRNVAYDVYQKVYSGYFTRILVMMLITLTFSGVIGWFQLDLLRRGGRLLSWHSWKHGLSTLFGLRKGFFTRLLLPYLNHYRPGFHLSDHDAAKLEKYWKDKLASAD